MKTLLHVLFAALASVPLCQTASARVVTLTCTATVMTNEVVVGSNEVVKAIYFHDPLGTDSQKRGYVSLWIGDSRVHYSLGSAAGLPQFTVAGPTTITLVQRNLTGESMALLTLEIGPSHFPPDKTLVIPEGGGANIALECSTNLIDWTSATLGVYTNQPSNKFFRLKAERLQ